MFKLKKIKMKKEEYINELKYLLFKRKINIYKEKGVSLRDYKSKQHIIFIGH